jgi:hypothetical protein
MRKKGRGEGGKCWVLVSDRGEGYSFAFKICRHIEEKKYFRIRSLQLNLKAMPCKIGNVLPTCHYPLLCTIHGAANHLTPKY